MALPRSASPYAGIVFRPRSHASHAAREATIVEGSRSTKLEHARQRYACRAWAEACELFAQADREAALGALDLESLALSAYLIGRDDDYLAALERAHRAHVEAGSEAPAVRCAFWLGLRLMLRGEAGRAGGWLARAQRLLDSDPQDRVERGYLLLPLVEQQLAAGDLEAAHDSAQSAADIGERFAEADLIAIARHLQGGARLQQGRVKEALALFDETMLAVTRGETSPLVTGLVYCGVIEGCQLVYAVGRAQEWTAALAQWCEEQPEMLAFAGVCQVHRSELLQLRGTWSGALDAAQRAGERCRGINPRAEGAASYQQGEVHRLRGELDAAEAAYEASSRCGYEPQPGLSLLRAAQGRIDLGVAMIRRVLATSANPLLRARLLPACVEILLATGELVEARAACDELERVANVFDTDVLRALAGYARGAVLLSSGDAQAACNLLRRSWHIFRQVEAPYIAARVRELLGLCCRALGDDDGGRLELDAARAVFEELGARLDVVRIDTVVRESATQRSHPLTERELQVLRLVAAGKTNKAIAAELFLSDKTIERHLSNIFSKLDVRSRAAATAYAYQHALL
jgi:ATP/maltotriose-dependent transcriptional regulator MalT